MKRILVVDDERQITRMLRTALQSSGYEVAVANHGAEALERLREQPADLIITDLAMPELNGVELTQAVRRGSETPIIVLSVRDSEAMKVRALDAGADDYVTKPFNMPELLARVRVQMRRVPSGTEGTHLEAGDFVVDTERHAVERRGERLHLTPKEFDLLLYFMRNPHRVLTHKVLLRAIWGLAGEDQPEYLRVLLRNYASRSKCCKGSATSTANPGSATALSPKAQNRTLRARRPELPNLQTFYSRFASNMKLRTDVPRPQGRPPG